MPNFSPTMGSAVGSNIQIAHVDARFINELQTLQRQTAELRLVIGTGLDHLLRIALRGMERLFLRGSCSQDSVRHMVGMLVRFPVMLAKQSHNSAKVRSGCPCTDRTVIV